MTVVDTTSLPRRRLFGGMPIAIVISLSWLALVVLCCHLRDLVAPAHYTTQDLLARFRPPVFMGGSWDHVLGTDHLGRDVLSRIIYALRTSISSPCWAP